MLMSEEIKKTETQKNVAVLKSEKDFLSHDIFPSVKKTRTYAVLQSEKDFSFHIWTKPTSVYHSHDNYIEIFIVTEGKIVHHIGNKQTVMKTGDAFIVFPKQYHKHSQYKNYESRHINLTCTIPFAREFLKVLFNDENSTCVNQLIHLKSSYFETVLNFQKLILESQNEAYWNVSLKSFIIFMFSLFYVNTDDNGMPDWLKSFIQKLNNINLSNNFKLSEIYKVSNYSQTTICREFKKYTGTTIVAYINDLRLTYACNLLKNTAFPLWEISNNIGFQSQAHFTRLFKEKYGITPLQYRKQ